ncbi:MAG: acetyl-CoA carboxylase biotin carboxyl carrier protein [Lysobacterales bacterium]
MDIRKIKKLVELLEESDLAEIEISENDESVRLSRMPTHMPAPVYAHPAPAAAAPPPAAGEPSTPPATSNDAPQEPEGHVIRSPMVGTFYASPNPESDPFVSIGQEIRAGDVVCIVEAMKMFNQIESDISGKLVSMLVETGQPVEFDQPLMIVR